MSTEESAEETLTPSKGLWKQLENVIDPELHYNIVEIGLVYDVVVKEKIANIKMTLTSPGCPYGPMIIHQVKEQAEEFGMEEANVEVVWDPPWGPEAMSEEIRLEMGFDI